MKISDPILQCILDVYTVSRSGKPRLPPSFILLLSSSPVIHPFSQYISPTLVFSSRTASF